MPPTSARASAASKPRLAAPPRAGSAAVGLSVLPVRSPSNANLLPGVLLAPPASGSSKRTASAGSASAATSVMGALNSALRWGMPQGAVPLPGASWATAMPCKLAWQLGRVGRQRHLHHITVAGAVDRMARGFEQLFLVGEDLQGRQRVPGLRRCAAHQAQLQVAPGTLHLGTPAGQRGWGFGAGGIKARCQRACRWLGAWRQHRHRQVQRGGFRDADVVADQPVGHRLQLQGAAGLGIGRCGEAQRQQQVVFIAVVDQGPDGQAARRRPFDRPDLGAGGQGPGQRGRQARITRIAPIGVPVRNVLQPQADLQRLPGLHAAAAGHQFGGDMLGAHRLGAGSGCRACQRSGGQHGRPEAGDQAREVAAGAWQRRCCSLCGVSGGGEHVHGCGSECGTAAKFRRAVWHHSLT